MDIVSSFLPFFKEGEEKESPLSLTLPSYERDQLISIIGNKRSIGESLKLLFSQLKEPRGETVFLDPFCGSGAVSRLARALGMRVKANDNQFFAYLVNYVYLTLTNTDLSNMFVEMGGVDAYYSLLNLEGLYAYNTPEPLLGGYLSQHYAPQDDTHYDGQKERLFFTAANARFFDQVRNEVEKSLSDEAERGVVIASLLYEASRKANTLGSFTAYQKRFVTEGSLARRRIVEPPLLRVPTLVDEPLLRGEVSLMNASDFLKGRSGDICYLDPPATVQQYGNNYHLLNTIAKWDNYLPSNERDEEGNLRSKGGIRSDWRQTYSSFCSLKEVDLAFVNLFGSIDARHIVLTYPANGIMEIERLYELLEPRHGPVSVIPVAKRNQGGRQSKGKQNVEYLFVAGKMASFNLTMEYSIELLPLIERLTNLTNTLFRTPQTLSDYPFIGGLILDGLPPLEVLLNKDIEELEREVGLLEASRCDNLDEGIKVLVRATLDPNQEERGKLEKRLYPLLRRLDEKVRLERVLKELEWEGGDPAVALRLREFLSPLIERES